MNLCNDNKVNFSSLDVDYVFELIPDTEETRIAGYTEEKKESSISMVWAYY